MIVLTITGKDSTKQITKMSNIVAFDQKNKPLTNEKLFNKISEIAQTIGGQNYRFHKFEMT